MKTLLLIVALIGLWFGVSGCVSVTTTPTPETPGLKNLMNYPVQVRITAPGKGDVEVWYGEELIWPENPYEMEGHWFILRPAVRHPTTLGGSIVRDELVIKANNLIMIFKPKPMQDFEEEIKEFIWVNTHAHETRDKRYCNIEVYRGKGLPLANEFERYFSPAEVCSIQVERFNWGYGITTEFVHVPVVFLHDGMLKNGGKVLRVGELWVQFHYYSWSDLHPVENFGSVSSETVESVKPGE